MDPAPEKGELVLMAFTQALLDALATVARLYLGLGGDQSQPLA